jgi:Uma2 family endonuclease
MSARQAAATPRVSLEDYGEAEFAAQTDSAKHEWFDGVVYAMSRGTPEHGRLTARITVLLGSRLAKGCSLYSSDTVLFVSNANLATYADVSVVCGAAETLTVRKNGRSLGQAVTNPKVIVEVLSEATERYDRDGKFQVYRQLASLEHYVLISSDRRQVEVFRKTDAWSGSVAQAGESIDVDGSMIVVDDLYAPPG